MFPTSLMTHKKVSFPAADIKKSISSLHKCVSQYFDPRMKVLSFKLSGAPSSPSRYSTITNHTAILTGIKAGGNPSGFGDGLTGILYPFME